MTVDREAQSGQRPAVRYLVASTQVKGSSTFYTVDGACCTEGDGASQAGRAGLPGRRETGRAFHRLLSRRKTPACGIRARLTRGDASDRPCTLLR